MIKTLTLSAALVIGAVSFASAGTVSGNATTARAAHHKPLMMKKKIKKKKAVVDYGVGPSGGNGRSTATGGNPGGYTNRN